MYNSLIGKPQIGRSGSGNGDGIGGLQLDSDDDALCLAPGHATGSGKTGQPSATTVTAILRRKIGRHLLLDKLLKPLVPGTGMEPVRLIRDSGF